MESIILRAGYLLVWIVAVRSTVTGNHSDPELEIKSLTGSPNYRSINLTWEVEDIHLQETKAGDDDSNYTVPHCNFNVYYCEIKTWGLDRCKSKMLEDNRVDDDYDDNMSDHQQTYSMVIDNLRMATKYSFHVRAQPKPGQQKAAGRADLGNNAIGLGRAFAGQTIVIPTKGFSAHATQCLPHASEIEVETGPYFMGKIMVEGSDCGIQGDPSSPRETYTMRIDHQNCGSHVHQNDLTVETFITVQENLGIFTHSTRRFVVVCSYQPDTLTVRASFAVPGREGARSIARKDNEPESSDRSPRTHQFKMVGRNALVLNKHDEEKEIDRLNAARSIDKEQEAVEAEEDQEDALPSFEEITPNFERVNLIDDANNKESRKMAAKYLRLTDDRKTKENHIELHGVFISVALSLIMIGTVLYILQRERKKQMVLTNNINNSVNNRPLPML